MNEAAAYHQPDYPYFDPLSPKQILLRFRLAKEDSDAKVYVHHSCKYTFQKGRSRIPLKTKYDCGKYVVYEGVIDVNDNRIAYVFEIVDGAGKKYFYSERGLLEDYDFKESYRDFFQYPCIHDSDLIHVPEWTKSAVFYQIFPDRFRIGNKDKDMSYVNMKWDGNPSMNSHAGGDLRGIIDSLDYLKDLGITALYLCPIFKADTSHKYDTLDYLEIDPHFGTEADLKELIDGLHARGMRIVLDGVYNHMSFRSPYFQDIVEKGMDSPYAKWFHLHGEKPSFFRRNYDTFAFGSYMPKINVDNPEAEAYLQKVTLHYLELGIDGWRLDVGDEISHRFWRRLRDVVKEKYPESILIGETWHQAQPFMRGDEFDGVMNYPFYYATLDHLAYKLIDAKRTAELLNEAYLLYRRQEMGMMLNLLESHDTARFHSLAKGKVEILEQAEAIMAFFPGMPCIYYGSEVPMVGGFDPDCRRGFPYEEAVKGGPHKELLKKILALKKDERLSEGDFECKEERGMLVLTRTLNGKAATLYVNSTDKPIELDVKATLSNLYDIENNVLKPGGFAAVI